MKPEGISSLSVFKLFPKLPPLLASCAGQGPIPPRSQLLCMGSRQPQSSPQRLWPLADILGCGSYGVPLGCVTLYRCLALWPYIPPISKGRV